MGYQAGVVVSAASGLPECMPFADRHGSGCSLPSDTHATTQAIRGLAAAASAILGSRHWQHHREQACAYKSSPLDDQTARRDNNLSPLAKEACSCLTTPNYLALHTCQAHGQWSYGGCGEWTLLLVVVAASFASGTQTAASGTRPRPRAPRRRPPLPSQDHPRRRRQRRRPRRGRPAR